ncbi:MAG: CHRD domain-containing protein [Thermomicrobiales bacterium]
MKPLLHKPVVGVLGAMLMLALTLAPALAQFENEYDPGTPEFERTWNRTDKPVEDGVVSRTWIWGPGRTEVMMEEYAESPGNMRQVQYFDKSRMEITNPNAQDDGLWYVTNGLLVVEMVTGKMQVGDTAFEDREPADVNIVGDPGNAFSPTYAEINSWGLRDAASDDVGDMITRTLSDDGEAMDDSAYATYNVTAAENVMVPGIDHTIAGPFWDFMNSSGPVWEDGQIVNEMLFPNPYYATGLPITEAYWTTAPVAGTETDVLWQCFERRCLTFTPANDEGFQVEAGNVGQHYWTWRYGQEQPSEDYDGQYYAELDMFNDSGVSGTASLMLDGDQLTVEIHASGLTPDQTHLQHIHGFDDGTDSTCADTDAYGPVMYGLEPFPMADSEGNIGYSATLTVDPEMLMDPTHRAIVLHGMMVDGEYSAGTPVACGEIMEGEAPEEPAGEYDGDYYAELNMFNDSGVSGTASLTLDGDQLTVEIHASGLTPDETHLQHIHGFDDGTDSTCADTDAYGPVMYGLEPFPMADSEGNIGYSATLTVDPEMLMDPTHRAIVIHGMMVDGEYNAGLPVACGEIMEGTAPEEPIAEEFDLYFGELNNSGVSATGSISLIGDQLTVEINGSGFAADMIHPQHIHGDDGEPAFCPGPDFDISGDDWVDLGEGVDAYGGVKLSLTIGGEENNWPTADADGNLTFSETYTVDPLAVGNDLEERVIVLHGINTGEEYVATMPIACSMIVPADATMYEADELDADNEVSDDLVLSDGTGNAMFWYDDTDSIMYYMLIANDVDDVTAAHIHQGGMDENGDVVAFLFNVGPEADGVQAYGVLSSGRITADDLIGPLEGMTLNDLEAIMQQSDDLTSDSYVNVHSEEYPAGVLRDQITAVNPEAE